MNSSTHLPIPPISKSALSDDAWAKVVPQGLMDLRNIMLVSTIYDKAINSGAEPVGIPCIPKSTYSIDAVTDLSEMIRALFSCFYYIPTSANKSVRATDVHVVYSPLLDEANSSLYMVLIGPWINCSIDNYILGLSMLEYSMPKFLENDNVSETGKSFGFNTLIDLYSGYTILCENLLHYHSSLLSYIDSYTQSSFHSKSKTFLFSEEFWNKFVEYYHELHQPPVPLNANASVDASYNWLARLQSKIATSSALASGEYKKNSSSRKSNKYDIVSKEDAAAMKMFKANMRNIRSFYDYTSASTLQYLRAYHKFQRYGPESPKRIPAVKRILDEPRSTFDKYHIITMYSELQNSIKALRTNESFINRKVEVQGDAINDLITEKDTAVQARAISVIAFEEMDVSIRNVVETQNKISGYVDELTKRLEGTLDVTQKAVEATDLVTRLYNFLLAQKELSKSQYAWFEKCINEALFEQQQQQQQQQQQSLLDQQQKQLRNETQLQQPVLPVSKPPQQSSMPQQYTQQSHYQNQQQPQPGSLQSQQQQQQQHQQHQQQQQLYQSNNYMRTSMNPQFQQDGTGF